MIMAVAGILAMQVKVTVTGMAVAMVVMITHEVWWQHGRQVCLWGTDADTGTSSCFSSDLAGSGVGRKHPLPSPQPPSVNIVRGNSVNRYGFSFLFL